MYRKYILGLLLFWLLQLFFCGEPEIKRQVVSGEVPEINSISPERAKIGDTLYITGENLGGLSRVEFNNTSNDFILVTEESGVVIVPTLSEEHVEIRGVYLGSDGLTRTDPIEFGLVGIFEITSPFLNNSFSGVHTQILNDSVYFMSFQFSSSGSRIFKSIDRGYTWIGTIGLPNMNGYHFFTETTGVVTDGNLVYYTADGQTLRNVAELYPDNAGQIRELLIDIEVSGDSIFMLSSKGELYATTDLLTYAILFDYPFANHNDGAVDFFNLQILPDGSIFAIGNSGILDTRNPILITRNSGQNDFKIIGNGPLTASHFFDKYNGVAISDGIYTTTDGGSNWTLLTQTDVRNFVFDDEGPGLGVFHLGSSTDDIRISYDRGVSWSGFFKTSNFAYITTMDLYEGIGIMGSRNGRIWKYIRE